MAQQGLWRTKSIEQANDTGESGLHRALSGLDLTLLGIGAIIGAGIFVLTGIAAATKAGPALTLSFVLAGLACLFAALVYAEFASTVPVSGSAYTYSYVTLGELGAWIIGWDLILEYSVASAAVAIGWSGYFNRVLSGIGLGLPDVLTRTPFDGGWLNLPAFLIILGVSGILALGIRESSRFNNAIVVLKLGIIALFLVAAIPQVDTTNWDPYFPFGWHGVVSGAGLIFFAYIGFDAVSTAAEEARNPQRDIPRGILGSLVICTLIYIIVAAVLTGIVPYAQLNVPDPVAFGLEHIGAHAAAGLISVGAIAGLSSVLLVLLYGQSRIFFVMSRDGLLPRGLSLVNKRTGTPVTITVFTAVLVAALAGVARLDEIAALANAGTLAAFTAVGLCLLVLRRREPGRARTFRTPLAWVVGPIAILGCIYLFFSLPTRTQLWFALWNVFGLVVYVLYSRRNAVLGRQAG